MSLLKDTELLGNLRGVDGCELHYTKGPKEHSYHRPGTIGFVLGVDEKGGEQLVNALERFHCLVIGIKNRDSKNDPRQTLSRCVSIIYDAFHAPRMKYLAVNQSVSFAETELEKLFSEAGQMLMPRLDSPPMDGEESAETKWARYEVVMQQNQMLFTRATEEQIAQQRAR